MHVTINYSDIIKRCKLLSAFDARESFTASGERNFKQMKVTEQEGDLLTLYIGQASHAVASALSYAIADVTAAESNILFTITSGHSAEKRAASLKKSIEETIVAYTLQRWYEDKSPERSKSYNVLYADMLGATKALAFKSEKPVLA
jgi:hypothetical protein